MSGIFDSILAVVVDPKNASTSYLMGFTRGPVWGICQTVKVYGIAGTVFILFETL